MGVKSNCFEAWKLTLNPFVESGSINIFCVCLVLYLKTFTRNNNRNRQNKNRLIDQASDVPSINLIEAEGIPNIG